MGDGAWVEVNAATARTDANARGATGYYRPEDGHIDPGFAGPGARFCWTNTQNEDAKSYAEVMCLVDEMGTPPTQNLWLDSRTNFRYLTNGGTARSDVDVATVSRFIQGDTRFNSFDNLDFQPRTGNMYVVEDHPFGEIYACLPDGADRDLMTDGCVSILSIRDPDAEPTGFIFDGTGRAAFVVLQHGQHPASLQNFTTNPVDGTTDDLLRITGWTIPAAQ